LSDAETTALLIAKEDAHLHQTHVIAKLLQFKNVELEQPVSLPDVETTKLLNVIEDVIHKIHQTNVIAKLML
jgi:hypothetical protein